MKRRRPWNWLYLFTWCLVLSRHCQNHHHALFQQALAEVKLQWHCVCMNVKIIGILFNKLWQNEGRISACERSCNEPKLYEESLFTYGKIFRNTGLCFLSLFIKHIEHRRSSSVSEMWKQMFPRWYNCNLQTIWGLQWYRVLL